MNKILLQCDNLCKRYQEGSVQTDVLHNVSFSVGEGEMMAIVGSSGSGKSTLLHLLGCATRSWALFISFTTCCRILPPWKTWLCRC